MESSSASPIAAPTTIAPTKSGKILRWVIFIFFFAPAPFYMCFSGCLGPQFLLPPVIAWMPVLTIFSLFSPLRWLWHGLFFIIFSGIFIPCAAYIDKQPKWSKGKKRFYKILLYLIYWILIAFLWSLIPLETRHIWLGQTA